MLLQVQRHRDNHEEEEDDKILIPPSSRLKRKRQSTPAMTDAAEHLLMLRQQNSTRSPPSTTTDDSSSSSFFKKEESYDTKATAKNAIDNPKCFPSVTTMLVSQDGEHAGESTESQRRSYSADDEDDNIASVAPTTTKEEEKKEEKKEEESGGNGSTPLLQNCQQQQQHSESPSGMILELTPSRLRQMEVGFDIIEPGCKEIPVGRPLTRPLRVLRRTMIPPPSRRVAPGSSSQSLSSEPLHASEGHSNQRQQRHEQTATIEHPLLPKLFGDGTGFPSSLLLSQTTSSRTGHSGANRLRTDRPMPPPPPRPTAKMKALQSNPATKTRFHLIRPVQSGRR